MNCIGDPVRVFVDLLELAALNQKADLRLGAGVTKDHATVAGEFALDFMFWPTKNVGWFVEPTWSIAPRTGEHSLGVSIGLLIGFQ